MHVLNNLQIALNILIGLTIIKLYYWYNTRKLTHVDNHLSYWTFSAWCLGLSYTSDIDH